MSRNLGRLEVREADPGSNPASGFGAVYLGSESAAPGTIYKRSSGGVLIPVGFGNPMTTQDDVIIGGASGAPTRLAKGSNSTFLGINGSGHLAYGTPTGFANPMTTSQDIIVGGASGAAGRLAVGANYSNLGVNGSGNVAYQQSTSLRYSFRASSDFWTGGSINTTWTLFAGSFSFTKLSSNSILEIIVRCAAFSTTGNVGEYSSRVLVTYPNAAVEGFGLGQSGGVSGNPFSGGGSIFIDAGGNNTSGSFSAEVSCLSNGGPVAMYCRAGTYGPTAQLNNTDGVGNNCFEWFYIQVVEHF